MPKMTILNEHEIKRYDYPPAFRSQDRKHFLTLPTTLQQKVGSFHNITNKVCFHLLFGYFKACDRFFSPARFRMRDIEFVCARLGSFAFAVDVSGYSRETISRHKRLVLEYFKCTAFDTSVHADFLKDSVAQMIRSQFRPKLIFNYMIDVLRQRQIELPSYNTLSTLITDAFSTYDKLLLDRLEVQLTAVHKVSLDQLLEKKPTDEVGIYTYRLSGLKHFNPEMSNKNIHSNVEKLKCLHPIFKTIEPLLGSLQLTGDAIRYYGELVRQYQMQQITRRSELRRYLYLLAFTAYQVYSFEDWLTDTLLAVARKSFNLAQKDYQTKRLENNDIKSNVRGALENYRDILRLQEQAVEILWSTEQDLIESQRLELLRRLFPKNTSSTEQVQNIQHLQTQYADNEDYFEILQSYSLILQKQITPIIKTLHFNSKTSDKKIMNAIEHFKQKAGVLNKSVPTDFLNEKEKQAICSGKKFKVSLFKILFFKAINRAIKDGSLNLKYSYRYKAFDEYLIGELIWKKDKINLLQKADLADVESWKPHLEKVTEQLEEAYQYTNENILKGDNKFMRFRENGKFIITTPKSEQTQSDKLTDLFPNAKIIPLSEVLATIQQLTNYLGHFIHFQPKHQKKSPDTALFYAGITALGCNLGIPTMAKVAMPMSERALENTVNWYFNLTNIDKANEAIVKYTAGLELPQIYQQFKDEIHTASDGQKFDIKANTIHAAYSYKYFKKGRGITAYSYSDERALHFYSTVFSPSEREATYVIDGLMHNEVVRSTIHSTDTHGYTHAVFALMNLLGFEFAPRIAKLYKQRIYSFTKKAEYKSRDYKILPDGYINTELIEDNWDSILRLTTSIKLKECSASQIFKRLNSYSRQHPVYQALKEYGKIIKSKFILKYIDDVELRRSIRKQLNAIEHSNRFSAAVCFANNGTLIFPTRQEQLIAESCKRLIKNAIICWNYLYLTRCIHNANNPKRKKEIIDMVKAGSAMAWKHIYFHGIYDFSDEKLTDSFNLSDFQNRPLDLDSILEN